MKSQFLIQRSISKRSSLKGVNEIIRTGTFLKHMYHVRFLSNYHSGLILRVESTENDSNHSESFYVGSVSLRHSFKIKSGLPLKCGLMPVVLKLFLWFLWVLIVNPIIRRDQREIAAAGFFSRVCFGLRDSISNVPYLEFILLVVSFHSPPRSILCDDSFE